MFTILLKYTLSRILLRNSGRTLALMSNIYLIVLKFYKNCVLFLTFHSRSLCNIFPIVGFRFMMPLPLNWRFYLLSVFCITLGCPLNRGLLMIWQKSWMNTKSSNKQGKSLRVFKTTMKKKKLTEKGLKRKGRIAEKLFMQYNQTNIIANFYFATLSLFKSFVLTFRQNAPEVHHLYCQLTGVACEFYACFLKHKCIQNKSHRVDENSNHRRESCCCC